eukprot:1549691-Lingulodinium_polyedra.AAC.1
MVSTATHCYSSYGYSSHGFCGSDGFDGYNGSMPVRCPWFPRVGQRAVYDGCPRFPRVATR